MQTNWHNDDFKPRARRTPTAFYVVALIMVTMLLVAAHYIM
jgi:hypothetical protein